MVAFSISAFSFTSRKIDENCTIGDFVRDKISAATTIYTIRTNTGENNVITITGIDIISGRVHRQHNNLIPRNGVGRSLIFLRFHNSLDNLGRRRCRAKLAGIADNIILNGQRGTAKITILIRLGCRVFKDIPYFQNQKIRIIRIYLNSVSATIFLCIENDPTLWKAGNRSTRRGESLKRNVDGDLEYTGTCIAWGYIRVIRIDNIILIGTSHKLRTELRGITGILICWLFSSTAAYFCPTGNLTR